MDEIKMVSLMAGNADFFYEGLADYLTRRTGIRVRVIDDVCWRERDVMLDRGLAQMGFVCGLQYVYKLDDEKKKVELLAAPVMGSPRYQSKPVYFSDVIVHRDSPYQSLGDLRGKSWACNEPSSHSGCNLIRYHMAVRGMDGAYFRQITESGSHQNSLAMVLDGRIDATAIDSTVLELELRLRPELRQWIRIIETLGPSPIPPAVISSLVPETVKQALRDALLMMHEDAEGRRILAGPGVAHFVEVSDSDYDPIRRMAREANQIPFSLTPVTAPLES